jgi:DNA-binding transcriptional regulator YiaG
MPPAKTPGRSKGSGRESSRPDSGERKKKTSSRRPKTDLDATVPTNKTASPPPISEMGKVPLSFVAAVRRKMGVPRKLFSRLTGFSESAIAEWEKGKAISEPSRRRIREIERFQTRLAEVVKPESIPNWLETPNQAFAGLKPLEVIERGEIDRLWTMIYYLESGVPS